MTNLDGDVVAFHACTADFGAVGYCNVVDQGRVWLLSEALNAKHHFHFNFGQLVYNFVDIPSSVSCLAATWPIQRDVCNNSWGKPFARQAVRGFPHQVAKQDVGVEMLFEGLSLEECVAERVA